MREAECHGTLPMRLVRLQAECHVMPMLQGHLSLLQEYINLLIDFMCLCSVVGRLAFDTGLLSELYCLSLFFDYFSLLGTKSRPMSVASAGSSNPGLLQKIVGVISAPFSVTKAPQTRSSWRRKISLDNPLASLSSTSPDDEIFSPPRVDISIPTAVCQDLCRATAYDTVITMREKCCASLLVVPFKIPS